MKVDLEIFKEYFDIYTFNFAKYSSAQQFKNVFKMCICMLYEIINKNNDKMFWFSTVGLGVHWLHFRSDTKPKLYKWKYYTLAQL
jgi:hypothetical protein